MYNIPVIPVQYTKILNHCNCISKSLVSIFFSPRQAIKIPIAKRTRIYSRRINDDPAREQHPLETGMKVKKNH